MSFFRRDAARSSSPTSVAGRLAALFLAATLALSEAFESSEPYAAPTLDSLDPAIYLLRDDPEWTPDRMDQAMNRGTERYVPLEDPVPVLIGYFTAWMDDAGVLNFRDDVYGHDERLANELFVVAGRG